MRLRAKILNSVMCRSELITNTFVGGIGAVGQAMLLAHALDSYPFKILMSPPGAFYSKAGLALAFIAPSLSLLALATFRSIKAPFRTAIPVVACPLIFFTGFRIIFALSGYHYASRGSDLIAAKTIEAGFSRLVLWLTLFGFVIGIVCGRFVQFVSHRVGK
jgi:hypothetical protein